MTRPVFSKCGSQYSANLANRHVVADAIDNDRYQVLRATGRSGQGRKTLVGVPTLFAQRSQLPTATRFEFRVNLLCLQSRFLAGDELVDANDDLLLLIDGLLMFIRCPVNLFVHVSSLDRLEHPTHVVDPVEILAGLLLKRS